MGSKLSNGDMITEEQVYRLSRPEMCCHKYTMEAPTWHVKGYWGTVSVFALSEEPNKAFVEWVVRWESADPEFGTPESASKSIKLFLDTQLEKLDGKPNSPGSMQARLEKYVAVVVQGSESCQALRRGED